MKKGLLLTLVSFGLWIQIGTAQTAAETASNNPNVRLGQKALLDGDFKSAASHLEKALPAESKDPNVMYMLGYAQYHSGELDKALNSFGQVIALKPDDERAYYYRGRLNNMIAVETSQKISSALREKHLNQAIEDFSKAISLNEEDLKLFQNRGVAYRDLGILLGTDGTANYDKKSAIDAYNKGIEDFKKVLSLSPDRKDIETEIKKATIYRDNLK